MQIVYVLGFVAGFATSLLSAWSSYLGFQSIQGDSQIGNISALIFTVLTSVMTACTPKMMDLRNDSDRSETVERRNAILICIWLAAMVFDTGSSIIGMLMIRTGHDEIMAAMSAASIGDWIAGVTLGLITTAGPLVTMYFYDMIKAEGGFFACIFGFFLPAKGA